jgi:phage/plasmid-associated DNA primase
LDFSRYHNRLIDYLQRQGIKTGPGNVECFNPGHVHSGKGTPSMHIGYNEKEGKETFICYNPRCGVSGDIYDAIGILEGITDKKEQYLWAEKIFDGGPGSPATPPVKAQGGPKEERFVPDPAAEAAMEAYLRKNPATEKAVIQFLKMRARASTRGEILDYPADILPALVKFFLYWPGLDEARRDLGTNTLIRCGIVKTKKEKDGKEKEVSAWVHSGVVVKLGTGYKLHYYKEGICEKRNSIGGHAFPMPGPIDKTKPVILVEGEMDALAARAAGIENVFSTGGAKGLTGPMVKEHLLEVPEIIMLYDADDIGRQMSGVSPLDPEKDRKSNIPEIIKKAGFAGKIRVAALPPVEGGGLKDPDEIVLAGKKEILFKVIAEAKDYKPPQPPRNLGGGWEAFDTISLKRLKSVIDKIPRDALDNEDVQPFISACIKSCKHKDVETELRKWGASDEEMKKETITTPYFLVEACGKYGVSKYLKNEIEKALIPASEILRRIKVQRTIVQIDFLKMEQNENAFQFLTTRGVRSAAQLVADVLSGRMIFVESEKKHYFYNGHTWQREPDMAGVAYNIICAVMRHFLEKLRQGEFNGIEKGHLFDILVKIEGRRFRVELTQDFSGLPEVFREDIQFDGPPVKESLTLADGVIDFSGAGIEYRKSKPEEYRREVLPYKMDDIKNADEPAAFGKLMRDNFQNEKTLETLMYYLSLIPSRNTQFKYFGIFVGNTHTGKTTLMELLSRVYPGMFDTIPAELMVSKDRRRLSGNEATPYLARLEGKGVGIVKETERNAYLNNRMFKELTGGDTQTARGLYQNPREFIPTAQILIYTNYQPRFDAHDTAVVDRLVVVPFMVQHERGKKGTVQQTSIYAKIRPEYPAIVRLFAEYYIKLKNEHEGAIPLSAECSNYKNNYIKEQETDLDKFVNDNLEFDMKGDVYEITKDVYERYLVYYEFATYNDAGRIVKNDNATKEALSQNKFTRLLKHDYMEINQKQKKINGEPVLCFYNVRLKPWGGKVEQPSLKDDTPEQKGPNVPGSYNGPPEEEMPF